MALGFLGWWSFVVASGAGLKVGGPWDFSITGQLGDSFGILSALMASFAAIFTYQTLSDTRRQADVAEKEAERLRLESRRTAFNRRIEDHAESIRRSEQLKREQRRDSEQTFFRLLDLRHRVANDLAFGAKEFKLTGTDAAEAMVNEIAHWNSYWGGTEWTPDDPAAYADIYEKNQNDLGQYFRTTYHLVRFADDRFNFDSAYEYVRILRAQLSNAELVLIALNCAYGEGREKFLTLVQKFALLHNINPSDRERYKLDELLGSEAFDLARSDPEDAESN